MLAAELKLWLGAAPLFCEVYEVTVISVMLQKSFQLYTQEAFA